MSDILCVTSRKLCKGNFLDQIEAIAAARPAGIILREKDLSLEEYAELARQVLKICERYDVRCILHTYPQAAQMLGVSSLHMPLHLLEEMSERERQGFTILGASCHSPGDALRARELGCTYITAGHIFATACKPGLKPRELDFLWAVCHVVDIPVYAIGGISPENIAQVREAGAAGACVMSGLMQSPDPADLLARFV